MRLRFLLIVLFLIVPVLYGEEGVMTFSRILGDVDAWKNRQVVLKLRLKQVDYLFEKISFYDSDNISIEFSFSEKKKKEELAADLLNAHEGVFYNVRFTILGSGNLGGLIGELHEFKPVYGDLIPEAE